MSSEKLQILDCRTGKSYEIPIEHNAVEASDFSKIRVEDAAEKPLPDQLSDGLHIVDEGFHNTAVSKSRITFLDATKGRLYYRGYDVSNLAGKNDFEDIFHLLVWGNFPSPSRKEEFRGQLALAATRPPQHVFDAINAYPTNTPPIIMLQGGLLAMLSAQSNTIPAFVGRDLYWKDMAAVDASVVRAMVTSQVVLAAVYCHKMGHAFTNPDPEGSFVSNLLLMMRFVDKATGKPRSEHVECIERLFLIYADHEMSNATAAMLHAASTRADPISCIVAALSAGYGTLHGGALDVAYSMLRKVGSPQGVPSLIAAVKDRKTILYGFGHRIYKARDPRAQMFRDALSEIQRDEASDPLLAVAEEIDRTASQDSFFTSRGVRINADFYACFTYTTL